MSEQVAEADHFLFLGLLLALIWVPLPVGSNHLWAWSFFQTVVLGTATIWLIFYALGKVATTPAFRRATPVLLLFGGVYAITVLQILPLPSGLVELLSPGAAALDLDHNRLSLDPAATRLAMLKTLTFAALFALVLLLVNTRGRLRTLGLVLVFSGVFQAGFGALMTLSGLEYGFFVEKEFGKGVVTGTFVNSNHAAGYLEMCLAVGVGMMLADMSTRKAADWRESARRLLMTVLGDKARVRIGLVIMVIGLVLTHSRMGNIAFFASLLIAGAFYTLVVRRVSTGIIVFFVSVLLVDIIVIGNFFGIEKVAEEIQQTTVAQEAGRGYVNDDTLAMIRDYPLTGTGAGGFESTFPMYESGRTGFALYRHAHNDYLEFAAGFGIPGFVALGAIVLLSLYTALSAQLRRRDRLMQGMACGLSMAIVSLLIHSAVDFNLQIPANAATFVVILAMCWLTRWLGHRAPVPRRTTADDPALVVELPDAPLPPQ